MEKNVNEFELSKDEQLVLVKRAIMEDGVFDLELEEGDLTKEEIEKMSAYEFSKLCLSFDIEILYYVQSEITNGCTHFAVMWRYCINGLHPKDKELDEPENSQDDDGEEEDNYEDDAYDSPCMLYIRVYSRDVNINEKDFHLSAFINGWTFILADARYFWNSYYSVMDGESAVACEDFNILSSMYLLFEPEAMCIQDYDQPVVIFDDFVIEEDKPHGILQFVADIVECYYGSNYIGMANDSDITEEERRGRTFENAADDFGWIVIEKFNHDTTYGSLKFALRIPHEDEYKLDYAGRIDIYNIFLMHIIRARESAIW